MSLVPDASRRLTCRQEKADTLLQRAHRLALAGPRMLHPDSADPGGQLLLPVPTIEVCGMHGGGVFFRTLSLAYPSLSHAFVCLPSAAPRLPACSLLITCMHLFAFLLPVCLSVLISCLPPLSPLAVLQCRDRGLGEERQLAAGAGACQRHGPGRSAARRAHALPPPPIRRLFVTGRARVPSPL